MVQSIEEDPGKLALAKPILTWVVLACRPLTVNELRCAVKLDINQTLQNATKAIPDLCGQLVFVDRHERVQMIHDTAREFLLAEAVGLQLSIQSKNVHTRLASLLLRYLSSSALQPSPTQRSTGRPRGFAKRAVTLPTLADTSLIEYACTFFSEHLDGAASADPQLMQCLTDFLASSNILSWIEHIARCGDLMPILRTVIQLRGYVNRRMKYVPQTDTSLQLVKSWVIDLIRVVAKFRAELLACPSSIHSLIPQLCPSESLISRMFGGAFCPSNASSGLIVRGIAPGSWDDCLARIDIQDGQATALSHGTRFFAIGLSTGQISVYDSASLQVLRQCEHPERVTILEFTSDDSLLASCSTKHLVIWDTKSGARLYSFPFRSPPLAITFLGQEEVLGAFKSKPWN
jgi:hypothetical protein